MRLILSLVASLAMTVVIVDLTDATQLLIKSGTAQHQGAKTIKLQQEEEEGFFTSAAAKTVRAAKVMLGIRDEEPQKSELQQLMDRRRKETTPKQGFFF